MSTSYRLSIRMDHAAALQKLLVFLGDWHTLANFQPVLMKAYYNVDLKEIVMVSGFRGETLNSVENAHISRGHTHSLYKCGKHCIS